MNFKNMKASNENECLPEIYFEVKVIDTEIYFFGDVTTESMLEFIEKFKILEKSLLKKAIDLPGYSPEIKVILNSPGGDVFSGLSAMNIIESSKVKVITVASGICASAATFLLLASPERYMTKNATILIHQISTDGNSWSFEDLKTEFKCCEKLMTMLIDIYKTNTKIPKKMFRKLMKRDIYLFAEECIKWNIVKGIAPF